MHNSLVGASLSEPHLALLLDEMSVCPFVLCTSRHALSLCTGTCVSWPKHVHKPVTTGILYILECLKVYIHVLQSVESSMESYQRPWSLLTKSEQRRQTSEEILHRRREQGASESAEEKI